MCILHNEIFCPYNILIEHPPLMKFMYLVEYLNSGDVATEFSTKLLIRSEHDILRRPTLIFLSNSINLLEAKFVCVCPDSFMIKSQISLCLTPNLCTFYNFPNHELAKS